MAGEGSCASLEEHGGSAALLVIDVQRALFDRSTPIYQAAALLQNINLLVDRAHAAGVPVVYVQHANEGLLVEGSEAWQLHPDLRPLESDLRIHKRHGNAFQGTPLQAELDRVDVRRLCITGLVTQGCVRATCLGARDLGYEVVLAEDAHSNYHRKAADVIAEWHDKLTEVGVELQPAAEIQFP